MGEYAEIYTMEHFGVDISRPDKPVNPVWKCEKCGKKLSSKMAQSQHVKDKHKKSVVSVKDRP